MILFFTGFVVCVQASDSSITIEGDATTWIIVRHAERDGKKDVLTEAGIRRAEQLAALAITFRVNAIYSTDTARTKGTAKPTATLTGLPIVIYGKTEPEWFEKMKNEHKGDVVLIVGHSNTTGEIAQALGGPLDTVIDENEYDGLFIVTTSDSGNRAVRIRFGD